MITQSYKLNIVPYAEQTVRGMTSPKVPVSQYDKGLRTLVFDLYDGANGRLTLLDGQTAKIYGKKPDANVFEYDMTISEDKQSVSIVLQEQMAVIAGCVECEVRIIDGSSTVGSANFILAVEKAPVGADEVYSKSEIPEIDNLLYGGTAGQVFTKTPTGAHWADLGTSSDFMLKSVYDPNDDGSVLKADHADDADTVDGHTVARNVLADEYTNAQIDGLIEQTGKVKTVNTVQPDQSGNVQITKTDIGLGNVDNTSDASKPISTATQAALDQKVDKVPGMGLSQNSFTDAEKEKLGDLPTDAEITAALAGKVDKETGKGLSTNDFTDAEKTKLDALPTNDDLTTALNGKVNTTEVGVANGIAELDSTGKVPSSQLPSYVDDVLEYASRSDFPAEGETGKIYVAKDTNLTYRWGGTEYVEISPSLALGETSSTAYRGDRGKTAYDHSQTVSGNPHNVTKTDVGLGNVDNTSDADKPISTATQTALDAKITNPSGGSTGQVLTKTASGETWQTPVSTAADVSYDNTSSGLTATNVQDATDELTTGLSSANNAITALSESVAPIETGTASQNYVVGDYLLLNGQFCKVTAAIATGETITVGTNVAETSVGDELKSNALIPMITEYSNLPPSTVVSSGDNATFVIAPTIPSGYNIKFATIADTSGIPAQLVPSYILINSNNTLSVRLVNTGATVSVPSGRIKFSVLLAY